MGNFRRKKYQKRLKSALLQHQDFLIDKLRKEWELLEKEERKRERRQKFIEGSKAAGITAAYVVLALAAIAGVVIIAAVAPNVFTAFGSRGQRRFIRREGFAKTLSYLKRKKLASVERHGDKYSIALSQRGLGQVAQRAFNRLTIEKPDLWDGKWRLIIFDIPEKHKWSREGFRKKLKKLGFYQFQKSVFVSPYPCFEEVDFIASLFSVQDFMRCIETPVLTNDSELREHFNLK